MAVCRDQQIADMARQGGAGYISAMVLGLNDALVELTGALAGFTMALPDNKLIILAGLTTGVAATLSMAAAEYLSQKSAPGPTKPYTAALFTGVTYLITVALLLLPYFIFARPFTALAFCLATAALIIMIFTWCVAKIRKTSFLRDCVQMLSISFTVAAISFAIIWGANKLWGINV